eukprot:g33521.t1
MFAVGDWRDAEKDKVKPTRTGFVDAIKRSTDRHSLGVVGGVDESFPPAMVYDVRSLPWIVLMRTDDMLVFCMKVEQHDELIRRLRAARFRFIDKGDVGVHRWTASGSRVRECKAICNAVSHGDSNPKIVVP